ncbi:hypothetical protein GCM10027059_02950 [Myceligenerans halotolerans]
MVLLNSNWRDWYHFRHKEASFASGAQFEDYVTRVLARFHDDFINPAPTGALGDGGADGLAKAGTVLYACYGQRPGRNAEGELRRKLANDFARGRDSWPNFHTWRFVTNAPVGPSTANEFTALQRLHGAGASRELTMRIWTPDDLWRTVLSGLPAETLDELYPGAPGIADLELAHLVPLLEALGGPSDGDDLTSAIHPVPPSKMDFNEIPEGARLEFNSGRTMAPRIDRWYAESADPAAYDAHGERFTEIYRNAREVVSDPGEILERVYVAVAGPNFRMDRKRANATYAVVAYFFDSCHIFEMPPIDVGSSGAAAN